MIDRLSPRRQGNLMTINKKSIGMSVLEAIRCGKLSVGTRPTAAIFAKIFCFCLLAATPLPHQTAAAADAVQLSNPGPPLSSYQASAVPSKIEMEQAAAHRPKRANFGRKKASLEARHVANWVVDSGDNQSMPFVIVDKADAKVFVFDANGQLRGTAPALLGLARGDDTIPGIGDRKLSSIRPEERTTPAGRFVAALGYNLHGVEILWVDYDLAISIHRVITTKPRECRLQRLATPSPLDNRISYGCINVPAKFFDKVVRPAFTGTNGIVYVLPETRSAREVFGTYNVAD
jgi:hypothetical protein